MTRVSSLSSGKVCPPPLPRQDHQHYRETGLSRHALFESHCAEPSNKLAPDPITLSGTKSCLLTPRHYPKDFGIALASLIAQQVPSGDLRNKRNVDPALTDREIFDSLKIGDVWWDAGLPDLYWYLRKLPSLKIPSSWESTIEAFETELLSVSCFQFLEPTSPSKIGILPRYCCKGSAVAVRSQVKPPTTEEELVGLSGEACEVLFQA